MQSGRRDFLTTLRGAVVWPAATIAQQSAISVIGFLSSRSPDESKHVVEAFREGLRKMGFVEGENLIIAFRWAEGRYDRLPALAAELVGLRVALLFAAGGTASALAAKASTSTIPIVFSAVGDPIGTGLIASHARGRRIKGVNWCEIRYRLETFLLLVDLVAFAGVSAIFFSMAVAGKRAARRH